MTIITQKLASKIKIMLVNNNILFKQSENFNTISEISFTDTMMFSSIEHFIREIRRNKKDGEYKQIVDISKTNI